MFTICARHDMLDGYAAIRGGQIGDGEASVVSYATSQQIHEGGDTRFITYEKTLNGRVVPLANGDAASAGVGESEPIVESGFQGAVMRRPARLSGGVAVSVSVDAIDRFLSGGFKQRSGSFRCGTIVGAAEDGPDGALLDLAVHALDHFESYRHPAASRIGQQVEALLTEVFIQLLRETGALMLTHPPADNRTRIVRRAREFIDVKFADRITIADVASAASANPRTLQAAFQVRMNTTPQRYLTSVRLERAHRMLTAPDSISVTTVAYDCGFAHIGRFGQIYRARYGELPSQTLRRARQLLFESNKELPSPRNAHVG